MVGKYHKYENDLERYGNSPGMVWLWPLIITMSINTVQVYGVAAAWRYNRVVFATKCGTDGYLEQNILYGGISMKVHLGCFLQMYQAGQHESRVGIALVRACRKQFCGSF
jgi:hypothetical protein